MSRQGRVLLYVLFVFSSLNLFAQDSLKSKLLDRKISKQVIRNITRSSDTVTAVKSEQAYMRYDGKIIRHISIRHTGFEQSIYDTARNFKNRVTRIANSLHSNTHESVIRDNLFIRENKPLNPYKLADNERYLRDLDFILDSKIIVKSIRGNPDSVDVVVITRDVFSLGPTFSSRGIDQVTAGLYDANLMGLGQRLEVDAGFEVGRVPFTGLNFLYRKSSIGGTLINGTIGVTQINRGISIGDENEYAYFLRLDRPLVSPYSRMAGGLELSRNWSKNVYAEPDSLFRKYTYTVQDLWVGYNLGINNRTRNRNRYFAAARYFRQHYIRQPLQSEELLLPRYNDQKFLLGELTFYKQNFYKTRYLYGFGRTEDVPYGHRLSVTTGWLKEFGMKRLYLGFSAVKGVVMKQGNFYQGEAGFGTFVNEGKSEDAFVFTNLLFYSKLLMMNELKLRQLVSVGYAKAFNPKVRELLTLNDELLGFKPDSLYGTQRISLRTETTIFLKAQLAGFRFAPFLSLENAFLKVHPTTNTPGNFYWGTTGGIRLRNENLIFGTIELRAFYFPSPPIGVEALSFKITTNVRLKYSGGFVRPPAFVRYN